MEAEKRLRIAIVNTWFSLEPLGLTGDARSGGNHERKYK
jgi:hypothetical protein